MRTTIDIPDDLYRRTKAQAALRGSSMKKFIIEALERDLDAPPRAKTPRVQKRFENFPFIRIKGGKKIELAELDLDDLLT